jgi:predicted O-methyltransferase YrrM
MASTCKLTKGSQVLGTGSVTGASASLTSWSATAAQIPKIRGRFVCVEITQAGTHLARTFWTRVLDDNGSGTLTLRDACPFVGA